MHNILILIHILINCCLERSGTIQETNTNKITNNTVNVFNNNSFANIIVIIFTIVFIFIRNHSSGLIIDNYS